MTTPHRATPELWAAVEEFGQSPNDLASCLLELRDRLAAAEQRIQAMDQDAVEELESYRFTIDALIRRIEKLEDNHPSRPDSSPAPAGGLVESVGAAICTIADCGDTPSNWAPEAHAAILAVADWFDAIGYGATASILRQEVQRHD